MDLRVGMVRIHYLPDDQLVEAMEGESILRAGLYFGIPHVFVCGGNARCSTCRIRVLEGLESCLPRTRAEQELADKLGFPEDVRLACQTKARGDLKVRRLVLDIFEIEAIERQVLVGSHGEEKNLAILFADIRGFTKFSERMLPYDIIFFLNCYFNAMGMAIAAQGGQINNYMGDGLVALFGLDDAPQVSERAVRAGLAMLQAMATLNAQLDILEGYPLAIGIGIHVGTVAIGRVGAAKQQVMTVIGDAVNFASRIEAANKQTGTQLLVSEAVYREVADFATVASTHQVAIAGKSGEYTLYEIGSMAPRPDDPPPGRTWWQRLQGWWNDRVAKGRERGFFR